MGASYIKSRKKRIFVFVLLFSLLITWAVYAFVGGGIYGVVVTLISSLFFEIASIFLYGLFSKKMRIMKLVFYYFLIVYDFRLHLSATLYYAFYSRSCQTGTDMFVRVQQANLCRTPAIWFFPTRTIPTTLMGARNTPPSRFKQIFFRQCSIRLFGLQHISRNLPESPSPWRMTL